MIALDNGHLRVELAPERGAEVRFVGRPGGRNALAFYDWASPVPASRSTSYGDGTLDWMSEYRGGWQELFPNAGAPSIVDGVPLPFHGEASASAWTVVSRDERSAVLSVAARLPLVLERRMTLADDAPVLQVEETVQHDGGAAAGAIPYLWGHHPAFDAEPGTEIDLPATALETSPEMVADACDLEPGVAAAWPRVRTRAGAVADLRQVPRGPVQRLCFLPRLDAGWAALRHAASGHGVALAWDHDVFPGVWLWQEIATPGLPWFGRPRITAIEPQSACPADGLGAHIARGSARWIEPGEQHRSWLTFVLFDASARPVTGVDRQGNVKEADS